MRARTDYWPVRISHFLPSHSDVKDGDVGLLEWPDFVGEDGAHGRVPGLTSIPLVHKTWVKDRVTSATLIGDQLFENSLRKNNANNDLLLLMICTYPTRSIWRSALTLRRFIQLGRRIVS